MALQMDFWYNITYICKIEEDFTKDITNQLQSNLTDFTSPGGEGEGGKSTVA